MQSVKYKQLVSMVIRLTRAGMDQGRAVELVSHTYSVDPDQLHEWIRAHPILQGGRK